MEPLTSDHLVFLRSCFGLDDDDLAEDILQQVRDEMGISCRATIPEVVAMIDHPDDVLCDLYRQAVRTKYAYLSALLEGAEAQQEFLQSLGQRDSWKELLDQWEAGAQVESETYLARVSQMPVKAVHARWYSTLPEFERWADLTRELLARAATADSDTQVMDTLVEVSGQEPGIFRQARLDEIERRVLAGWRMQQEVLKSFLDNLAVPEEAAESLGAWLEEAYATGRIEDAQLDDSGDEQRLLARLIAIVNESGLNVDKSIKEFLIVVRDHFGCDVADVLLVQSIVNGREERRLVLHTSTVDPSVTVDKLASEIGMTPEECGDEDKRTKLEAYAWERLVEAESYSENQGITGSIFSAVEAYGVLASVGTNYLSHDYRQSERHKSHYEHYYSSSLVQGEGRISDFWTFPIFVDEQFRAVFRLVNRKVEPADTARGLSFSVRLQARFASTLFSLLFSLSDVAQGTKSMRPYVGEEVSEQLILKELQNAFNIDWVDDSVLFKILTHMQRLPHHKAESRSLGCSLLLTKRDALERTISRIPACSYLGSLPARDISEMEKLLKLYDALDPLRTIFLYDETGKLHGTQRLHDNNREAQQLLHKVTAEPACLALVLEKGSRSILVYARGRLAGEVYLSERQGDWHVRCYEHAFQHSIAKVRQDVLPAAVVKRALMLAFRVSYRGHGALLVVGDWEQLHCDGSDFPFTEMMLDDDNLDEIAEIAKLDGATFISDDGRVVRTNTMIRPVEGMIPDSDPLIVGRGARHKTGFRTSKECPDALVIVVSENRSVLVLHDKSGLRLEV